MKNQGLRVQGVGFRHLGAAGTLVLLYWTALHASARYSTCVCGGGARRQDLLLQHTLVINIDSIRRLLKQQRVAVAWYERHPVCAGRVSLVHASGHATFTSAFVRAVVRRTLLATWLQQVRAP